MRFKRANLTNLITFKLQFIFYNQTQISKATMSTISTGHVSLGKRGCPSKSKMATDSKTKRKYSNQFFTKICSFFENSPNFYTFQNPKKETERLLPQNLLSLETSRTTLTSTQRLSKSSKLKVSAPCSPFSSTASSLSTRGRMSSVGT
jgi:hypothetical protein